MIPVLLTLQGIYSYQEKQTIDFTRLTIANIFGIFGTVGSGKSAILEAITYALYGRTDRLNLAGDNRNYNMMNLKSNDLLIEFIFKTGKDDSEYLATVKSHRNNKRFEDVKTFERAAYKKTDDRWEPVEVESLEKIIGLSYENFKRTIIIPQGKFQEFLQLGRTERNQMMVELFNLNKYELYYKVVSLEAKNNQQIQNLEGQLQQIGEISPDQVIETEKTIDELNKDIEIKSNELLGQQQEVNKLNELKRIVDKIKETEQTLSLLKEQETNFERLEKSLKEYEYCRLNFQQLIDSSAEIAYRIKQFEKVVNYDNAFLLTTSQELTILEKNFETIKKDYEGKELLKQKADELSRIEHLQDLEKSASELKERISKGEEVYNNTIQEINILKGKREALSGSIKTLKEQTPDMALLSEVRSWFTENKMLVLAQKDIDLELEHAKEGLEEIQNQKSELWKNQLLANIPSDKSFKELSTLLDENKATIKQWIDQLNKEIEHLSVQSRLETYASELEEGKPCPLCGALSHPHPLNIQNVSETLTKSRARKDSWEKDITSIEKCLKSLSERETKLQLKKELLEKINKKQAEHKNKISTHQKLFVWEGYNEDKVSKEFLRAEEIQSQLKDWENELDKTNKKVEDEDKKKEKYNKAIEEFRRQFTAIVAESSTLISQIKLFNFEEFKKQPSDEIEKQRISCLTQYQEIEKSFETTNKKIAEQKGEQQTITGRLQANQKSLNQELESKKSISEKIQEQLKNSGYTDISIVEKVLLQPIDLEKEKKKLENFRQTFDFSKQQLVLLKVELGDKIYNEKLHQNLLTLIQQNNEEITFKNQKLGKLKTDLENLKANLQKMKDLGDRLGALKIRADDIKTLKQLFKANGFVNFISSVYLQELCHAANERFYRLTNQKLSLEISEDNNFQVRDFLNGGKTRSIKTLSGGQVFQAALSLALALADNIQKITESNQNFFFLDEGFGSLDKDSLNIVFDTLKLLRKENRIVGVISHVEEMQQEIDTHLRIVNDEERGSIIKTSWSL